MSFSRRRFLLTTGASTLLTPALLHAASDRNPFTLGVASGSPRDRSVILWTRLAPDPLQGGGMTPGRVDVRYRVCSDPAMRRTVRDAVVSTSDAKGHAVHVKLDGLEPGREYWYQFYAGDFDSPVGRTRTTSIRDGRATFALASCQSFETGHFAAYRDMAEFAPDCVIHVGDYIYEGGPTPLGVRERQVGRTNMRIETVRQHNGPEIVTLWDYRNRYALYRSDPDLQAAHAASPWIVAMDDHEIDNNWAADIPQDPEKQTPLEFKVRKLAALQAYYEHMPIDEPPSIRGLEATLRMHGVYRFGPAQVHLLDTRQYRSDQVCGDGFPNQATCDRLADPSRTMTGAAQEQWLLAELARSEAPFNVLAQQTWFAPFRYSPEAARPEYNMDQWDGYPVQRQRLIDAMARASNPVVLSGDWHCASAMAIHREPDNARSRKVGHEFAGTSISSVCPWADQVQVSKSHNPHVAYVEGMKRGYLRCTVDRNNWTSTYRTVDVPTDRASAVRTDVELRTSDI